MAHAALRSERRTISLPLRPCHTEARIASGSRMFDLSGKAALVTGASGGIGAAIARALHRQGATLAISGTRRDVLHQLADEMKDRVHVAPCNLADKSDVEALVPSCEEAMGKLDILVANAGIARDHLLVRRRH